MKNIFVVDDNLDSLSLIESILVEEGFDVQCFSNWETLYDQLGFFTPSLILLDVYLGPADGRYIAKQLKENYVTSKIPVILFSSDKQIGNTIANDFLAKPFSRSVLLEKVNKYVQNIGYTI